MNKERCMHCNCPLYDLMYQRDYVCDEWCYNMFYQPRTTILDKMDSETITKIMNIQTLKIANIKKPLCKYCDEPLLNKQTNIKNQGYCNSQCKHHDEFFNETEMKTKCHCGEFATVYETTKGPNKGNYYYKCSKGFKGCNFWKWV